MSNVVLVLNLNYEPLNICGLGRAVALVGSGKAEILASGMEDIRTARAVIPRPSVIKLQYLVRRPRAQVRLTRREVFIRDDYTCQYCGLRGRELTLDHVIPRHLGGRHVWDNLVSACRPCNHRKGGKRLDETRMRLARPPRRPPATQYRVSRPTHLGREGRTRTI
ncbi:MAG: HNH endonuclease [Proteobacteria bacterium]|nr:HNH endonuclease [Pseudomonadota bacterium]